MLNPPSQGEGYTPAYQISATPFVTSSIVTLGAIKSVQFPTVTRFITVKNCTAGTVLAVAFTENGLKAPQSNFFILSGSETFNGEFRCDRIWLSSSLGSSSFSVAAGLTFIPLKNFLQITGSLGGCYTGAG